LKIKLQDRQWKVKIQEKTLMQKREKISKIEIEPLVLFLCREQGTTKIGVKKPFLQLYASFPTDLSGKVSL